MVVVVVTVVVVVVVDVVVVVVVGAGWGGRRPRLKTLWPCPSGSVAGAPPRSAMSSGIGIRSGSSRERLDDPGASASQALASIRMLAPNAIEVHLCDLMSRSPFVFVMVGPPQPPDPGRVATRRSDSGDAPGTSATETASRLPSEPLKLSAFIG